MQIDLDSMVKKIQENCQDATGQWCTKSYIINTINIKADDLAAELSMLGLGYDEQRVVITLPATTGDLSAFQATGQPLANMIRPKYIEWKLTTDPDTSYEDASPVDRLPDVDTDAIGIEAYTFLQSIVQVTPSSQPLTVRVTAIVMRANLVDDDDSVIAGTQAILCYRISSTVLTRRGNTGLAATNMADGDKAWGNFELLCVKLNQGRTRRPKRCSGRGRGFNPTLIR